MRIQLRSLLWVITFVTVTGLMIVVTGVTFARVRIEDAATYSALFTDAAGMKQGFDVRASGVTVGTVKGVELADGGGALVTFTVPDYVPMTRSTEARIRYANLTGDRYLDLTPGENPTAEPLEGGAIIPMSHTLPALDLDTLFAGFDPLMRALDPSAVNELTRNLIAVTDGQAPALKALMGNIGSFTTRLAERDQLIGTVITHLTAALATIDRRRDEFDSLVVEVDHLLTGLAQDRQTIGRSLAGINELAANTATLLKDIRPDLKANVDQAGELARVLNNHTKQIQEVFDLYPSTIQRLGGGGAYGSFFNYFMCSMAMSVTVPGAAPVALPPSRSEMDRCKFPEDR
jgi:phospholipid/cholesterol/gamma-HCH transport system substrate-binding protein